MQALKAKKLIILGYVVAGLVLVAGAVYVTVTLMNANKADEGKKQADKEKLVAPAKVMTSLQTANTAAKDAYDAHQATKKAFNEKPVRLVEN